MGELNTEELFKLLAERRDEMKEKYNRVLPTGELLFNRFEKAEYIKAGKGSSIYDTAIIMGDVIIGENVWVGPYSLLEGIHGRLEIGDGTAIGPNTFIYTHDASKNTLSGGKIPYTKGNVSIGKNTHISFGSMIGPDLSIGNHCLIGANAFIKKDIPDNSIALGSPAKIVGKVIVEENDIRYEWFKK